MSDIVDRKEFVRLLHFANSTLRDPLKVNNYAKVARGQGNLFNGYPPPPPSFAMEEGISFIQDFVRLNPENFSKLLDDDALLTIAEIMRIVIEEEQRGDVPFYHLCGAEALREAALSLRSERPDDEVEDLEYLGRHD